MKLRDGFVSNSSSASFIVNRHKILPSQLKKIIHTFDSMRSDSGFMYKERCFYGGDAWDMKIECDLIIFNTFMDNFPLYEYMTEVLQVRKDAFVERK